MAKPDRAQVETVFRTVLVPFLRGAGVDAVDDFSDDELIAGQLEALSAKNHIYRLPNIRVFAFVGSLLRAGVTDDQWLLGRLLWSQLWEHYAPPRGPGPPIQSMDRMFIFLYVEVCRQVEGLKPRAKACERAGELFGLSPTTIDSWYSKGRYTDERVTARQLVELASMSAEDLERLLRYQLGRKTRREHPQ